MFLTSDKITELHVEPTNHCNAACPMCDRNMFGAGLRPNRGLSFWTIADAELVFNGLPNLKRVFFCGTHGDPLANKHIVEIIAYAKSKNLAIDIFTNGGLRSISTWKKLLDILTEDDSITFGIDGIETNHLYRQHTNINVILKRITLSANAKVQTCWDFLAFKHNEHEIETCSALAKQIGCTRFRIRRTPRFDKFDPFPVFNNDGEITHYLEPPINDKYKHPSMLTMKDMVTRSKYSVKEIIEYYTQLTEFELIDTTTTNLKNINCIYKNANKMYVNSRLEVFPCCYISDTYETYKQLTTTELKYPTNTLTLQNKTWNEILSNTFFAELIQSWTSENIMPRCSKTCGTVNREAEQNLKYE